MSKKVVVSGYYGFDNFGDDAILFVLCQKSKNIGAEISVLSANPEKTSKEFGVESIKNFDIKDVIILSIIGTLYTITLVSFIPINAEIEEIDNYSIGKITDDKRDVIVGMGRGEYLTTKSNNNREYLNTRRDNVEVIKGSGNIENYNKKGQDLTCTVQVFEEESTLEFPYIYYPGYEIIVNGENVSGFESENGFLAISVEPNQKVDVTVKYVGTTIMMVSKIISIIGIVILIMYIMSRTEMLKVGQFKKEK